MYLVFDIGGTNIRLGVSKDGQSLHKSKIVLRPKDFDEGIAVFKQVANQLSDGERIEKIAGGIAGPLDKEKTMLISSPHISQWVNRPFKKSLESAFGARVFLENDSALDSLGEAVFGPGKDHSIVGYIQVGTGVGGAKIIEGELDKNSLGFEPGHQIIVPDGKECNCGGRGHLESYISGAYMERNYGQKGENLKDVSSWEEIAKYLAIGLYNSTVFWSPEIIILGGAVTQSIPLDKVKEYFGQIETIFPNPPEIQLAALGSNAGLFGALTLL